MDNRIFPLLMVKLAPTVTSHMSHLATHAIGGSVAGENGQRQYKHNITRVGS